MLTSCLSSSCQIVNLIEETGHFNVTNTTFDFDLFSLDESTVRKLQSYLEATATWQEVENCVRMAAAMDVDVPLGLLCKETTSSYTCRICFTGVTESSNNYHANRNTQANTSTHKEHMTPTWCWGGTWRRKAGVEESSWALSTVRISTTHLFFFWACAELWNAPPPLHSCCPRLCKTQYFPSSSSSSSLWTHTLLTRQNTPVPLPLLSAGAHFSPT